MRYAIVLLFALVGPLCAQASPQPSPDDPKLSVTVADAAGAPITNLNASSFAVIADADRPVTSAVYKKDSPDIVLLIEGSAFTKSMRSEIERMAIFLIAEMGPQERMAVYRYAERTELLQEFTSDKQALVGAVKGNVYENAVSIADATYATLDTAFQSARARRVLVVLSGGAEGVNNAKSVELVEAAERRHVSIFGISLAGRGAGGGFLDDLTRETCGIFLSGRQLNPPEVAARNLFHTIRGHYELTVSAVSVAGPLKVEIKTKDKVLVGFRRE